MLDKKFFEERKMCKYISAEATYKHLPSAVIKHLISFQAVKGCNTMSSLILGHVHTKKDSLGKCFLENSGLLADVLVLDLRQKTFSPLLRSSPVDRMVLPKHL